MGRPFVSNIITSDKATGGARIEKSVSLNDGDNVRFHRTGSVGVDGNRRVHTVSMWMKKTVHGSERHFFSARYGSGEPYNDFRFENNNRLNCYYYSGNWGSGSWRYHNSNRRFRDSNGWYHFVLAFNSTLSTNTERVKIYINGERILHSTFSTVIHPNQNHENAICGNGYTHAIGGLGNVSSQNWDGGFAECILVDGAELEPTDFAFTDDLTGHWKPKRFDPVKSNIPNKKGRLFSSTWTASGNGFGSSPVTRAYDAPTGNLNSNYANNDAGGQILTWDTSSFNLKGSLRIYGYSSSGVYDVYVNGQKAADTPSSHGWFDCGTHAKINEIQFAGTSYNTNNGLGSAGIYFAAFIVDGVWLRDDTHPFGQEGHHINFSDTSGLTATTIGRDHSGSGNNFTPANLQAQMINVKDSCSGFAYPTSSPVPVNYATFLEMHEHSGNTTFRHGLRTALIPASNATGKAYGNIPMKSGKWYFEVFYDSASDNGAYLYVGLGDMGNGDSFIRAVRGADGEKIPNTGGTEVRFGTGDYINVAVDLDNGKWFIGRNGTYWYSGDPVTGTGYVHNDLLTGVSTYGGLVPRFSNATGVSGKNQVFTINFGQKPFNNTVPSGYKLLSTNAVASTSIKPTKHFDVLTYTGNSNDSSGNVVTGLEFQPDFVWIKARSGSSSPGSQNHYLVDSVRGATGSVTKKLYSNSDGVENSGQVDSHNGVKILPNGFKLTSNDDGTNANNEYVAWCWKAGGPAVSNTDGDVTSQVSVNEEAGFSIVSFTTPASGSGFSIGHGLSKAPEVILMKNRSYANNWDVYHHKNGSDPEQYRLILNSNAARQDQPYLDDTVPTSTVFRTRTGGNWYNGGNDIIAYCWYAVPGYSAFGSYIGDGSGDGPFLNLGFTPRWILLRCATNAERWVLMDTKRPSGGNQDDYSTLSPNETAAENSSGGTTNDFFANGFKMLGGTDRNISGQTHVYMAFAETPQSSPITDTQSGAR